MYQKGVQSFLIDDEAFDYADFPNATFILVENTVKALHLLASHHRA
ncbi:MAG: hypothetical protein WKF59_07615 [Chitinophagaceae bacterium]